MRSRKEVQSESQPRRKMVGTREIVFYRNVLPAETTEYCRHLQRLDAQDRSARFFLAISDAALAHHCDRISWSTTEIVACFVDGTLRGAIEICRGAYPRRNHAELATSVEKSFQGRGIGTELTQRALVAARNRFIRRASMVFLGDNVRVRSLVRRHRPILTAISSELTAEFLIPAPSPVSALRECWQLFSCCHFGRLPHAVHPLLA